MRLFQPLHFTELLNWPADSPASLPEAFLPPIPPPNDWQLALRLAGSRRFARRLLGMLFLERLLHWPGSGRPAEVLPLLVKATADASPVFRALGVRAASRQRGEAPDRVGRRMEALLSDPVAAVRAEAALAALRFGRLTRTVFAGLTAQLSDPSPDVRRVAARVAAGLGRRMARPPVLALLSRLLRDGDARVAAEAAGLAAAGRVTPDIRAALLAPLGSPDSAAQTQALRAVRAGGTRRVRRGVLRAVYRCCGHAHPGGRREALLTTAEVLRPRDDPPTEPLIGLLADGDAGVRKAALALVARLGRRVRCDSIFNRVTALIGGECSDAALLAAERLGRPTIQGIIDATAICLLGGSRQAAQTAAALGITGQMGSI